MVEIHGHSPSHHLACAAIPAIRGKCHGFICQDLTLRLPAATCYDKCALWRARVVTSICQHKHTALHYQSQPVTTLHGPPGRDACCSNHWSRAFQVRGHLPREEAVATPKLLHDLNEAQGLSDTCHRLGHNQSRGTCWVSRLRTTRTDWNELAIASFIPATPHCDFGTDFIALSTGNLAISYPISTLSLQVAVVSSAESSHTNLESLSARYWYLLVIKTDL